MWASHWSCVGIWWGDEYLLPFSPCSPRLLWNHDYRRRGHSNCLHVGWYQTRWQLSCHNGVRHNYGGMGAIQCWHRITLLLINVPQTLLNNILITNGRTETIPQASGWFLTVLSGATYPEPGDWSPTGRCLRCQQCPGLLSSWTCSSWDKGVFNFLFWNDFRHIE